MNTENITKLRDHIAQLPPETFDLSTWFEAWAGPSTPPMIWGQTCGTPACIAGHALGLFMPKAVVPTTYDEILQQGAAVLGLDDAQAADLFCPKTSDDYPWAETALPEGMVMGDVTSPHAVAVLNWLLATGEVDWSIIDRADSENAHREGSGQ